jgi:PAS domain S-box-containing protein
MSGTRKKAQQKVRVRTKRLGAESLYRRLFESAREGILILDSSTCQIIEVNPFMVELLGFPRDEFLGKELWELGFLGDTEASRNAFRELQQKGHIRYINLPLQTKFGERREVEFVSTLYSEGGQEIIQCNVRDISERKQAEEQLREAHSRLSFHVENTPLGVIEWDRDFRVARWSRSAEAIFGWKAEEVIGRRIGDWRFVFQEDVPAVEQLTSRQRVGSEQTGVSRNRNYTKDGSVLYCEWYNSVLHDRTGELESVLSLVLDVTARKHAEEERAHFLAGEQAARREAEEANRIKDDFLATLSHELRTPLTAIVGWAHLLANNTLDPALHPQALETILHNAKSQGKLIEDLLDVSRIIVGKLHLDARPVDLGAVVQAAVSSVRLAAQAKGIRLDLVLDSSPSQVSGDPDRLQQVVWNLLTNAIKFTPGGGSVGLRVERGEAFTSIEVRDTGQGIAPEFLPFVFERFRQGDASSARQHRGLGLGLAIVRHLVELHGGMVEARSDGEGCGATFTVTLPVFHPEHIAAAGGSALSAKTIVESFSEPPASTFRLDGLRVLVVDDESDARQVVGTMLRRSGADVAVAGSVEEAMQLFESCRPDVLVADIGMPGEDGYSLIRRVRERPPESGGQIPAVALTAYVRTQDRIRVLSNGYQMHVPKPVESSDLISAVARVADRRLNSSPSEANS